MCTFDYETLKMKKCTKCNIKKPETKELFYVDNSKSCGFHPRCKECTKDYMLKTREHRLKVKKKYRENNKKKIQEYAKPYHKKYREENKEKIRNNSRNWKKHKNKTDPIFKIKNSIGRNLRLALKRKNYTKRSRTYKVLGISYKGLYDHLCSTFEENYGIGRQFIPWDEVHIDHIIPQSTANTEKDIYKLNHYTNLQLLFAEDNLDKSNKLEWSL